VQFQNIMSTVGDTIWAGTLFGQQQTKMDLALAKHHLHISIQWEHIHWVHMCVLAWHQLHVEEEHDIKKQGNPPPLMFAEVT
jgi:hypothetical protein